MRKLLTVVLFFFASSLANYSFAILNLELTRGVSGAVPIAIAPFAIQGMDPSQNVSDIISNDLRMSGRFKVYGRDQISSFPSDLPEVNFNYFKNLGADNLVIGKVTQTGPDRYQISFQLLDVFKGKESAQQSMVLNRKFDVSGNNIRAIAHHISDLIYQQITGVRGVFSTRLAYILVQRDNRLTRYMLEISDADGYNPRTLLSSHDPIMSPAWSPNGRQIAYVTFEKKHAAICIQDVSTGSRHVVSEFVGINGAPAWSPDGRKLALVLSKEGTPNIYILDLATHHLNPVTKDLSINTEPAWSPDGKKIIFTSNRSGGGPQIYQKNLMSGEVTRLTFEGNYNARASFARDGNHIVVLNKESSLYNIGVLDLNTGVFKVLTNSGNDSESPSLAPNGTLVLYGTLHNGRSVLGMVATDGSVQMRMPARNGEVQDPSWSPYLS